MEAVRPAKLIDPVCGMTVDVAAAEVAGVLLEYEALENRIIEYATAEQT
jgi:5,10-methenyltetrahydromethanopterin hydrogenase